MDLSGVSIGKYHLLQQIGQGGMATVYKAHQPSLDRYVAIKVLKSDLAQGKGFVARFEREARTIAKLRHRNILTIFDYGHEKLYKNKNFKSFVVIDSDGEIADYARKM